MIRIVIALAGTVFGDVMAWYGGVQAAQAAEVWRAGLVSLGTPLSAVCDAADRVWGAGLAVCARGIRVRAASAGNARKCPDLMVSGTIQ
ncbi:MAG: hypothetical protein R3E83_11865 [Burkholderiaceae bacterium]